MKLMSTKCPDCGAALEIEEGRTQVFCSYCGAKIHIDDEAKKVVTDDKARVREAEAKERIAVEKEKSERWSYLMLLAIIILCALVSFVRW